MPPLKFVFFQLVFLGSAEYLLSLGSSLFFHFIGEIRRLSDVSRELVFLGPIGAVILIGLGALQKTLKFPDAVIFGVAPWDFLPRIQNPDSALRSELRSKCFVFQIFMAAGISGFKVLFRVPIQTIIYWENLSCSWSNRISFGTGYAIVIIGLVMLIWNRTKVSEAADAEVLPLQNDNDSQHEAEHSQRQSLVNVEIQ